MSTLDGDTPVLILGVGNILFKDEGIGVAALKMLEEQGGFPAHVVLMDGGTMGMGLMDILMSYPKVIILDAVLGDSAPGTVYRLEGDDLRKSVSFRDSMHQIDLSDTLALCELAGKKPDKVVVIGMEPADYHTMELGLTPICQENLLSMCALARKEI